MSVQLDMNQPYALAPIKVNHVLGGIKRNAAGRQREVVVNLYLVLERQHLEYEVLGSTVQDTLEQIQRRVTTMIQARENDAQVKAKGDAFV